MADQDESDPTERLSFLFLSRAPHCGGGWAVVFSCSRTRMKRAPIDRHSPAAARLPLKSSDYIATMH